MPRPKEEPLYVAGRILWRNTLKGLGLGLVLVRFGRFFGVSGGGIRAATGSDGIGGVMMVFAAVCRGRPARSAAGRGCSPDSTLRLRNASRLSGFWAAHVSFG